MKYTEQGQIRATDVLTAVALGEVPADLLDALDAACTTRRLGFDRAMRVLTAVAAYWSGRTGTAHPAQTTIAEITRIDRRLIRECLDALIDAGLILEVGRKATGNRGSSAVWAFPWFSEPATVPGTMPGTVPGTVPGTLPGTLPGIPGRNYNKNQNDNQNKRGRGPSGRAPAPVGDVVADWTPTPDQGQEPKNGAPAAPRLRKDPRRDQYESTCRQSRPGLPGPRNEPPIEDLKDPARNTWEYYDEVYYEVQATRPRRTG